MGATAYHKVDVPASWATAEDNKPETVLEGRPDTVKVVKTILNPIGRMDGYSLPFSAFADLPDGQFPWVLPLMRSAALPLPFLTGTRPSASSATTVPGVCPHATIRPYALTAEEAAAAPAERPSGGCQGRQGQGRPRHIMAVSLWTAWAAASASASAPPRLSPWFLRRTSCLSREVFNYMVSQGQREEGHAGQHRQGFSVPQASAGVLRFLRRLRETSYARLVTQLFGDRMYISQRHRLLLHLGRSRRYPLPYTVTAEGRGPAWANPCSRTTPSMVWVCTPHRPSSVSLWQQGQGSHGEDHLRRAQGRFARLG